MSPAVLKETFATHGVRCTIQRERIYAALMASDTHPTADELFRAVRAESPAISLATVYNTLEVFTRSGLARRIAPNAIDHNNAYRYDADTSHHAHVVTATGEVRDLPDMLSDEVLACIPEEVIERVAREMNVRVGRISIEFVEEPTLDHDEE